MAQRKDSIIAPLLHSNIGHERLFMRFFAILLDLDREFLIMLMQKFFPKAKVNANDMEIWFDKHLMSKFNYPQPDIIITNKNFWVGEKNACFLIEIKRGAPLGADQIKRYENALNEFRILNRNFIGDLCVLVDNIENKEKTDYEPKKVFTYHDLEKFLIQRKKELSKKYKKGKLNTPIGYLIEEFMTLLQKD
jgi:hypothetical protein